MAASDLLKRLPSVDEAIKSPDGQGWLAKYPRRFVLDGIRQAIELKRMLIISGRLTELAEDALPALAPEMEAAIKRLASPSLVPVINATGIVMHTNLGRSPLTRSAIENIARVAEGYSNLEYDLATGKRGKRYSHIVHLLRTVTGAEDAIAVNNNAAAVLLCLAAMARGREVIVSRGELVEIGGSFRVPEVMAQSGAILREVGATNKTHLRDYEAAINENTALILKVHQSNFRMVGFTEEVSLRDLVLLGRKRQIPVMYDMGSGCLVDLKPHGIHDEPTVQEIVKDGPDVVTFSGDKLLGGPQAGMIVGNTAHIQNIARHPLTRALRIDKLTLAALESTLADYVDIEGAIDKIPTLSLLLEPASKVKRRADGLARAIGKATSGAKSKSAKLKAHVMPDVTYSGGGALPAREVETFVVSVEHPTLSANELEERLRKGSPAVIGRIKEGRMLLDTRTISQDQIALIAQRIRETL